MTDELEPRENIERRMSIGDPNLELRLRRMRRVDLDYDAIEISMVPTEAASFGDDTEELRVYVPVAYWETFREHAEALVRRSLLIIQSADPEGLAGKIVTVQGEPREGAMAMYVDHVAVWMTCTPAVQIAALVDDDAPAPYGSVFLIHEGVPRVVVPAVAVIRDNYSMAPGLKYDAKAIPEHMQGRDQYLMSVVDPRHTILNQEG